MDNIKLELAYMAGVLDGDGSFSIIKTIGRSASPLYYPMIQLANVSEELIKYFHRYGGNVGIRKSYTAKDGGIRKECYQWKINGSENCLSFLEDVIPYLVIKKDRALFLRDYIDGHPFKRGSNKLSDEELMLREKAYIKMRQFNDIPDTNGYKLKQNQSEDKEFWAYVAGIMDSDGSFSIKKEKRGRKSPTYSPLISIGMTDCRAIYYIASNFVGGHLLVVKAKTALKGFCYRFSATSKIVVTDFIKKCMPYLLVKKEQAKVLLNFCENSKTTKCRMYGIDEHELEFREKCYAEIINLNKYGVSKSSLMDLKLLPGNAGDNKAEGDSHRERSKREDLCCENCKIPRIFNCCWLQTGHKNDETCDEYQFKMRCSEHCRNAVRRK